MSDTSEVDFPGREFYDEQDMKRYKTSQRPHLNCKEISRGKIFPVSFQERPPGRFL